MLLTLITETRVFLVRAGFRSHSLNTSMTIGALDSRDLIKVAPKMLKFVIIPLNIDEFDPRISR